METEANKQIAHRGVMSSCEVTFGKLLQIIFKYLNESPKVLAEFYLDRDRTLVYKWLKCNGVPTRKLVPDIVRFVLEKSCESERHLITNEIKAYIGSSDLYEQLRKNILEIPDFQKLLEEVFYLSIAESNAIRDTQRKARQSQDTKDIGNKAVNASESAGSKTSGIFSQTIPLPNMIFAILAAVSGGLFWNLLNNILGLGIFMGGSGNEPSGPIAFVWGVTVTFPVILFAMLSLKNEYAAQKAGQQPGNGTSRGRIIIIYTVAGGIAGFVFYNCHIRGFFESMNWGYEIQELFISLFFSFILSFVPFLAALLVGGIAVRKNLLVPVILLPVFLTSISVTSTFLIHAQEHEINQLRGFIAGFVLRLSMYIVIRYGIKQLLNGHEDHCRVAGRNHNDVPI